MREIWAIILAAGESKRMGSPKMLLPFHGSTMIENVLLNVTGSRVAKTMIVLGAVREPIIQLTDKYSTIHCFNDNYREGMLSSVICGFRNLASDYKAVLIFQGDQPLITTKVIDAVIDAYLSSGKGIVIPVCRSRRGHPILIDRKYHDEIGKLSHMKGLRSLASKFSDDVQEVETDEPGILRDFDTFNEYMEEINKYK